MTDNTDNHDIKVYTADEFPDVDAYVNFSNLSKDMPVTYVPDMNNDEVDFCDLEPGNLFVTIVVDGDNVREMLYKKINRNAAMSLTGELITISPVCKVFRAHIEIAF